MYTSEGKDAIGTAVQNNHFKFLNRLFGFGANPKYLSVETGDTPIHAALYIALERDQGNTRYLFLNLFFLLNFDNNKYKIFVITLVCFYKIFNTYEQIGKRMKCVSISIAQFIDKVF